MSRNLSVMKTFISLLLSTLLALPHSAVAQSSISGTSTNSKEIIPVLIQDVVINGHKATQMLAPVPAAQEEGVVVAMSKVHPENTILQVTGVDDPAFKAAKKSGFLRSIKTYVVGDSIEQTPLIQVGGLTEKTKTQLKLKFQAIKDFAKSEDGSGLMYVLTYAGIQGAFTYYASSSVSSGMAVFTMYTLWNCMVVMKSEWWDRILEGSGYASRVFFERIADLLGQEMGEREKRLAELVGKVGVSWAISSVQAGYVKGWAGDFEDMGLFDLLTEGILESGVSGLQNNYNIWDAVVLDMGREGKITPSQVKKYFKFQLVAGAIAESLAFRHIPGVGAFLAAVTSAGIFYLAVGYLHPVLKQKMDQRAKSFHVAFRAGPTQMRQSNGFLRRGVAALKRRFKKSCEDLLSLSDGSMMPSRRSGLVWDDVQ